LGKGIDAEKKEKRGQRWKKKLSMLAKRETEGEKRP